MSLRKKMRGERGSTMLFALFLFLICAVVGAVILTAATAASGRRSRMIEVDARYYAVGSAADIVRELIESQSVKVVRTRSDKDETVFTREKWEDGEWHDVGAPASVKETTYDLDYDDGGTTVPLGAARDDSIVIRAVSEMFGVDFEDADCAEYAFSLEEFPAMSDEITHTYTLSHVNASGIDADALEQTMRTTLDTNGNYRVRLSSADGSYTVALLFKPVISESGQTETKNDGAPEVRRTGTSEDGYPVAEEIYGSSTIEHKTTEIRFTFDSMTVIRADETDDAD